MVALWRKRFLSLGIKGLLKDAPRPGRTPSIPASTVEEVIRKTTQATPLHATHWSTRTMARAMGISEASVRRIWRGHGLKPHRVESFKISRDPEFVNKLEDIVGLYLNPPEHALVLSVDEKSQIQALDRTQPGLPMKKGRGQTMTHDYKRNGTTTLFAALNTATGEVYGLCQERHRHQWSARKILTWEMNDFSVGTTWEVRDNKIYLIDLYRGRVDFPSLKRAVMRAFRKHNPSKVIIEDKASGTALIQELTCDGLYCVESYWPEPGSDKFMRFAAQAMKFESGRIFLPSQAPWREDYIREITGFPGTKHDDQVDSTSQALDYLSTKAGEWIVWERLGHGPIFGYETW